MKLPTIKRILREDVKDAPGWIGNLIDPLNTFMETVYQALNRNLTLTENIASFVTELTYRTPSTYPSNQEVVSFQNQLRTTPTGVILLQIIDKATYSPPVGPVYIPWVFSGTVIQISPIPGLVASKTYTVRLAIF